MLVRRSCARMVFAGGAVVVVLAVPVVLTGCNTVRGVGEDITDASDATKHAISGDGASHADSSPKGGSASQNRD